MSAGELTGRGACDLAAALRAGDISAVELLEAFLAVIAERNPALNAIVSLAPEQALEAARHADRERAAGRLLGPLHGLPIAIKDLEETRGVRTTWGSPLHAEHVPENDAPFVARVRAAGAIIVGKTNVPEFGAGSHTFNPVFGPTRNPYDTTRTAGGSSGGAAAAVAAGMLPFADGSDYGGSLRNPASFCNILGLRPSPGRVPNAGSLDGWDPFMVSGPMARSVDDLALLLAALCGPEPRTPIAIDDAPGLAPPVHPQELRGLRVAWSPDLGGLPVEPAVRAVLDEQIARLEELGCIVERAEPRLADADEAFETVRALGFASRFGPLLATHRDQLKESIVWNAERGLELTPGRITRAFEQRTAIFRDTVALLDRYDVLAAPATQVLPFPVEVEWPREVADVPMEHYLGWMRSCTRVTVTAHPALSLPAGFSADGLPVGLQLVGRYRDEAGLLRVARAIEQATGFGARRPGYDTGATARA